MKNIENWKFANRFSAIFIMAFSAVNVVVFYILSLLIDDFSDTVFYIILTIEFGLLFYFTETKME
jgi:hypothetical protein